MIGESSRTKTTSFWRVRVTGGESRTICVFSVAIQRDRIPLFEALWDRRKALSTIISLRLSPNRTTQEVSDAERRLHKHVEWPNEPRPASSAFCLSHFGAGNEIDRTEDRCGRVERVGLHHSRNWWRSAGTLLGNTQVRTSHMAVRVCPREPFASRSSGRGAAAHSKTSSSRRRSSAGCSNLSLYRPLARNVSARPGATAGVTGRRDTAASRAGHVRPVRNDRTRRVNAR